MADSYAIELVPCRLGGRAINFAGDEVSGFLLSGEGLVYSTGPWLAGDTLSFERL